MPLLAGLLGGMFTKLFDFFATFLTKRIAIIAAVVTAITALYLTFATGIQGLIDGVQLVSAGGWFDLGLSFLPENTNDCLTAIIGGKLLSHAYIWNARIVQYKLL